MESTRFSCLTSALCSSVSSNKNIDLEFDFSLCHGWYLCWH